MHKYSVLALSLTLAACSGSGNPLETNLEGTLDTGNIPGLGGPDISVTPNDDDNLAGFSVENDGTADGDDDTEANISLVITGEGQIETINNTEKTDITIAGSNHTVNIESDIGRLLVGGSNSVYRFSANVTVDFCTINGSDNTAELAENVMLNCEVTGSGNMGFE